MRPDRDRGGFDALPDIYGRSVLGAPLEVWMPVDAPKHLLVAGVHGEEPDTCVLVSRALRSLSDPLSQWAVVVCANPDGVSRGTRANANGVDINRNFPSRNWSVEPVFSRWVVSDQPKVRMMTGTGPSSEPETRALLELIGRIEPEQIVAVHGPLECIDDPGSTPLGLWLSARTAMPLVEDIGYPTPGSLGTWGGENNISVVTYELPVIGIEDMMDVHMPTIHDMLCGHWQEAPAKHGE